jgi:hypothetical protein
LPSQVQQKGCSIKYVYKNAKGNKRRKCTYSPLFLDHTYLPLLSHHTVLFIQGCSIKYWKGWDFEYTAKRLFTPVPWSCIFIPVQWPYIFFPVQWSYIFIPVPWSYIFIPVLISSWRRKGCSIKYRKGWKWEKIGIREGKAQIHPCFLILHIYSLFSGHTYLSLFSSPVAGEKAAQ